MAHLRVEHQLDAMAAAAGITRDQAARLYEELEELLLEQLDAGITVRFPVIGDVNIDEDEAAAASAKVIELLDVAGEAGRRAQLTAKQAKAAIARLIRLLDAVDQSFGAYHVPVLGYLGSDAALSRFAEEIHEEAVERIRAAGGSIWLLQCNPHIVDVLAAVEEDEELPSNWSVDRYLDELQPGDRVVFWISGDDAGVYALGEIDSYPYEASVDERAMATHHHPDWTTFVDIDLYVDLFDHPIARAELKADPRFAGESIIKVPAAANPHKLSAAAFEAILDRL